MSDNEENQSFRLKQMKTVRAYSPAIEEQMQRYYKSLSEKDRRRYAAIEAVKIGYGGISYIHRVLGCVRGSIRFGNRRVIGS